MEAIKFDEKSLSRFPVAFYFSAVEAFDKRIMVAECGQERFQRMRDEYSRLFVAFDEAYKRTQKSELTAKIAALDKERDGYAYVMQKVAEAWAAKLEDETLAVHGRRVAQVFRDYGFRTSEALVAENAKIHNMEQKLAERELVSDLQMMGLTELNRRLLSRTEQIEQLMGKRNEEKSDVVVGELKAAREKLDGHYRAFVTYLNAGQEEQLACCYRTCLWLAQQHNCNSIAFCCISTGDFHFPNRRAAEIAVDACREARIRVIFNVYKDIDYAIYKELLRLH